MLVHLPSAALRVITGTSFSAPRPGQIAKVKRTIARIAAGRDEFLDKAIEVVSK